MVKVLLADDSQLTRSVLKDLLAGDPDIELTGEARDGFQAVEMTCRLKPDLVLMDVVMPVMDGIAAVIEIMARCPTPILVLSANVDPTDSRSAFNAISHGALDVMAKPAGLVGAAFGEFARELIARVKTLARIRVIHHFRRSRPQPVPPAPESPVGRSILAIGASTGGPRAIMRIIRNLLPTCQARILIVQHIARGFAAGFAEWLEREGGYRVRLAREGELLESGVALVAPNDLQLEVRNGRIRLSAAPPVNSCRPSIDVLFQSLVKAGLAPQTVAVLLTGMGQDGAAGMAGLKLAGSYNIAQDEASCTVFGMPRSAIQRGAVHQVLPLDEIPGALQRLLPHGNNL
jgi:two-component system chemotaxis response regulator CheB